MNFIFDYPTWFLIFCPILGAVYTLLLYFRDKHLSEISLWWQRGMAALRFLTVSILTFLVLGPMFKSETKTVMKPVIVVAQDNSQSLIIGKDSTYYKEKYLNELNDFINKVSSKYEVKTYTFGNFVNEGLKVDYSEKVTGFNDLMKEIYTRYVNRNLGAMVIASDGIYNQGTSPESWISKFNGAPIFTLALGDTTIRKDVILTDVEHNRLAYLGNEFPVNVLVEARKCAGKNSKVRITKDGNELFSQEVKIDNKSFAKSYAFKLEAKTIGLQRYRIEVLPLQGELTEANNYKDIFVEVLDSRQKILILAHSPHPDIRAIKDAILSNKNYEVTTKMASEFNGKMDEYSLVIFHQLPSQANTASALIAQAKKMNLPAVFVLGSQSNITGFNNLDLGLTINGYRGTLTPANGSLNRDFNLFSSHEDALKEIPRFPPLQIPFGDYTVSKGATVLVYQKIGPQITEYPLIYFNKETAYKTAVICGEGLWRWKFNEFRQAQNTEVFADLMQKMVQYMASKENRNFFRVFGKTDFKENENILFDAEVYNESYELVNTEKVSMSIKDGEGIVKKFDFTPTSNAYRLDAGRFAVGNYTWEANVTSNGKAHSQTGEFSVSSLNIEMVQSIANHQMLNNLSTESNGKLFYPGEWDKLADALMNSEDIVSTTRSTKETLPLIEYKIIFFLLVLLLGAEWFTRKRMGSY